MRNDTLYRIDRTGCAPFALGGRTWRNGFVSLYQHGDGSLWMGTSGNGLFRLKNGKCVSITRHEGLFDNVIHQILEDDRGRFWMSSNKGIFYVPKEDLDDLADVVMIPSLISLSHPFPHTIG